MGSGALFLYVLISRCLYVTSSSYDPPRPPSSEQAHDYLRFADVERHCQSVLVSAAGLSDDAYRATRVKREMTFDKGDWHQAAGGHAPLVPFDGSDVPSDAVCRPQLDPLSLATFVVTHVDDNGRRARTTALNVSGVLVLSVSRKSRDPEETVGSPEFELSPGRTKLKIIFQGVYTESGDGERVLCMVGSAVLPRHSTSGADPWDWANDSGRSGFLPPVTADDNILLVLRYPKELTLTTRVVVGEMRSTSAESAATYFDPVHLVSQLHGALYQFRSQDLVADACDSLPSSDVVGNRARHLYNGAYLCEALKRYIYGRGRVLTALPNWHDCNSTATTTTEGSCRRLGPFELGRAAGANEPRGVGITIHDLKCDTQSMSGTVGVSAVFRATPPSEDPYTAALRSGLNGATLSAEGVWNTSIGQACLVACRGAGNNSCHFRVCFYMPMTFSITDRSVLVGRITSINDEPVGAAEQSSLSFQLGLTLPQYWGWDGERLAFRYNYTKVKRASELLRRKESVFSLRKVIAKLLPLSYPNTDRTTSLGGLTDTLALRFTTAPSIFTPDWIERPAVHLEIIFLGQASDRRVSIDEGRASSDMELPINVSAELTVFGKHWLVMSTVMSLEGVYNPQDGRMYLIGCRDDVRLPSRNLSASKDLEEGNDCSIEVEAEYPPTTTHWFIWSTAKVRIASTRNADDPLRFSTMKLQAVPFRYPQPRPPDLNRGLADGVVSIVLLSASIAASLSQMTHLKTHADVAPYTSLVMLCVQAVGFGFPLTTGIEALLARPTLSSTGITTPKPSGSPSPSLVYSHLYQSMGKWVRILSLAGFVITRQLIQDVQRSRARALARVSPLEPERVPGDAKVLACFTAAHMPLPLLVFALNGQTMRFEEHVGLMQDLFLLPQVIGNVVWRVNCKPLAGSFYLGVTAARMLPHLYEFLRPPAVPVYDVRSLNASRSVFSSAGDAVVPAASILLALVVYAQQRWNYVIASRMGLAEQRKLQHVF